MFLAVLALAGLVQNDPAGATAFMQQVLSVSRERSLERSVLGMTYRKRLTVVNMEDDQNLITEESKMWTVRAIGTGSASRLIMHDGITIANEPGVPDFNILDAMETKYRFKWAAEPESGEGDNRCFNVEFEPIDPNADDSSLEERIANHLAGTACIDVDGFYIRRIEAHLFKPFKIKWGAKMKRMHITIVQRLVDGLPVYEWSQTDLYYAWFGIDSVKRHSILYDSWQLAPRAPAPSP